jgi:glycine betaine/choline ABC-type transport system substrate-binding protein
MDSERPPDYSKSRAVLIGTSEYRDEKFPALPAADNSLEGMRQMLTSPELCGWPASRVRQLSNVSDNRQLIVNLRQWARETSEIFFLYYVGHGTPDEKGPCLALTDTQLEYPDATGLEYRQVRKALRDSPARVKIVILDCCYAGRAIRPVQSGQTLFTDISGTYVLAAADHAAHVPENQELACTSFTCELLDLIRKGITDGPEELTLEDIYRHLRARLGEVDLPDPNCGGTDTVGAFRFARNAAFRQGPPIPRLPQEPQPVVPWWRRSWRTWGSAAVAAALLAGAAAYTVTRPDDPGPPCGPAVGTPALPDGSVVIGSDLDASPENQLIADIYRDALQGNGVRVDPNITPSLRAAYYDQVCSGAITIVPEYNGALLTTSVDQGSTAVSTTAVDNALDQDLPPSLEILAPAPAQDKDSVTVTDATAARYGLKSIADLRRVAGKLTLGAPVDFDGREQGTRGLKNTYGVAFGNFISLDYNNDPGAAVIALLHDEVEAADVYTTTPEIKANHLVVLADPQGLFRAENVVPLVYKPALQANPKIATILNYVSLRLTEPELLALNFKAVQPGASLNAIATEWSRANIGSSDHSAF